MSENGTEKGWLGPKSNLSKTSGGTLPPIDRRGSTNGFPSLTSAKRMEDPYQSEKREASRMERNFKRKHSGRDRSESREGRRSPGSEGPSAGAAAEPREHAHEPDERDSALESYAEAAAMAASKPPRSDGSRRAVVAPGPAHSANSEKQPASSRAEGLANGPCNGSDAGSAAHGSGSDAAAPPAQEDSAPPASAAAPEDAAQADGPESPQKARVHPRFFKQAQTDLPTGTTPVPNVAFPDTPVSATPNQTPDDRKAANAKAANAEAAGTATKAARAGKSRLLWIGVGAVAVAVALVALRASRRKQ